MKIKITIDRFEGEKAVLKTDDNESIIWPRKKLPEGVREGTVIAFNIGSDKEDAAKREQQAKDILNEILNTD